MSNSYIIADYLVFVKNPHKILVGGFNMNSVKKVLAALSVGTTLSLFAACSSNSEETASIKVICESKEIYQLYYTCYDGDESLTMGGFADLDGKEITESTDMTLVIPSSLFNGNDTAEFAVDFSPYGKNDTSEIATTKKLEIPLEYGKTYTVRFSGNPEEGFKAELEQ